MNSKTHMNDDEIDLTEIFKKLWKEKVLIIGLSLLFGVLAYGIGTLIPKKFEASVKINSPSIIEFQALNDLVNFTGKTNEEFIQLRSFINNFWNEFNNKVFSVTVFADFLQKQDDAADFAKVLGNNADSLANYLLGGNFKEKEVNLRIRNKKEEMVQELIFMYPQALKGHDILNRYIRYQANQHINLLIRQIEYNVQALIKNNNAQKTVYIESRKRDLEFAIIQLELDLQEYVNVQTRSLTNKLYDHQQALKTAKSINLEDSIPTSILRSNSGSILNEPGALFYKGAKVLNSEIENIESDLKNLDKTEAYNKIVSAIEQNKNQLDNLDKTADYNKILTQEANLNKNLTLLTQLQITWNPILQQATEPEKHISPKKSIFVLVGLFLGFFISLLVIFFRSQPLK